MNLHTYIFNTQKKYAFKIGIVNDNSTDNIDDTLETVLKKYGIIAFSTPKSTPVLARPLDFPMLSNVTVTYWDVELHYPTFPEALRAYISQMTDIPENKIVVRHPDSPIEEYQQPKENTEKPYEPLLTKLDMGGDDAQSAVGQNRVMELLKELEKLKKEKSNE